MANVKKVFDDCYAIYEKDGYTAVIDHVNSEKAKGNLAYLFVNDERCDACDNDMPSLNHVCLICGQSTILQKGTRPNYFEVKSLGWNAVLGREEIQINCGENGMLMIVKTDEGFVVDAYDIDGENINTMAVWEDDINSDPFGDDEQEPFEDGQPRDKDGILTTCPVCGSTNTHKDLDFPTTMRNCKGCMSEWNINDEVTFNGREGLEEDKPFDPNNINLTELEDFIDVWGQFHDEVCAILAVPDSNDADDILMINYFWYAPQNKWIPKCTSLYTEREQAIADYLRNNQ